MSKDYPCIYWNDGKCKKFSDDKVTSWCVWSPCASQTPSNADRIRAMSDEELAMLLYEIGYDGGWGALEGTLDWLRQPAEKSDKETVEEREDGDWNG